jgi:two-component system, chemotaxis family, chemotaxis protein CheY
MAAILIVEDENELRDLMIEVLEGEGHEVAGAGNGRDALARLRVGAPPDLILLDSNMPVMSGAAFRAVQCADAGLAGVPVIVLSGDGDRLDPDAFAGVAGYLSKPFRLAELVDAVSRCCPT